MPSPDKNNNSLYFQNDAEHQFTTISCGRMDKDYPHISRKVRPGKGLETCLRPLASKKWNPGLQTSDQVSALQKQK